MSNSDESASDTDDSMSHQSAFDGHAQVVNLTPQGGEKYDIMVFMANAEPFYKMQLMTFRPLSGICQCMCILSGKKVHPRKRGIPWSLGPMTYETFEGDDDLPLDIQRFYKKC